MVRITNHRINATIGEYFRIVFALFIFIAKVSHYRRDQMFTQVEKTTMIFNNNRRGERIDVDGSKCNVEHKVHNIGLFLSCSRTVV